MKFHKHENEVWFYCPGCKRGHSYQVPRWTITGDLNKPTFRPSLRLFIPAGYPYGDEKNLTQDKTLCHLHITDGRLEYCSDCPHEYAGKTIDAVDFPANYGLPGVE